MDHEAKGEGNSYDFGARIYDPRIGRWHSPDPKKEKYVGWSPYHFGYNSPIITIDPNGEENIIVVGTQFSGVTAGNKLQFIHQAMRQMLYYRNTNDGWESRELTTIAVFAPGYSDKQLNALEQVAKSYGAQVLRVSSVEELTNYINSKSTGNSNWSPSRAGDFVTNVDIFAHGLVGSIEFGYDASPDVQNALRFDKNDVLKIDPAAMRDDAVIASYACRTGLGDQYGDIMTFDRAPEESLAQIIANHLGVTVKAFERRTDYSGTLGGRGDRWLYKLGLANEQFVDFQKRQQIIDNAVFYPGGALHPVRSGNSPVGASTRMETYTPEAKPFVPTPFNVQN